MISLKYHVLIFSPRNMTSERSKLLQVSHTNLTSYFINCKCPVYLFSFHLFPSISISDRSLFAFLSYHDNCGFLVGTLSFPVAAIIYPKEKHMRMKQHRKNSTDSQEKYPTLGRLEAEIKIDFYHLTSP